MEIETITGTLRTGDVITFAGRPKWWRRVLIRWGWMKPKTLPVFIVTSIGP